MGAIWTLARVGDDQYPALRANIDVDVAVVGGGITGLTVALKLAEAGRRVAVLEAGAIGAGNTGKSTGNLYSTLAKGLTSIREKWGDDVARDIVNARSEAIDTIENLVQRFGIDCQFQRRPLYRVLTEPNPKMEHRLDDERHALRCAGLTVHEVDNNAGGLRIQRGLKLENQAQFNPLSYARGLARAARELGVAIHENSPVREINYNQSRVKTDSAEIQAVAIVHATHTPKGINLLQTGMVPSREYGVSARLKNNNYPEGIFWVLDGFHSLRSYHHDGSDYIMVIGEKHKVGEGEPEQDHYANLRRYLGEHFEVQAFEHQWSAQQFSSADGLPYIGKMHGLQNAYVATGFAADGLVWGTLAGDIISELIQGREQGPWARRFDASRFTPVKSLKGWAAENVKVTKDLVWDYLTPDRIKTLDNVSPGTGRVVSLDGRRLAVYRDGTGQFSVVSAVCPHMKCLVRWNNAETSWDCPCHGSRFSTDGEVIEGPAYHPLQQYEVPVKQGGTKESGSH